MRAKIGTQILRQTLRSLATHGCRSDHSFATTTSGAEVGPHSGSVQSSHRCLHSSPSHGQCPVIDQHSATSFTAPTGLSGPCKAYEEVPTPFRLPLVGTLLHFLWAGGPSKLHLYNHGRHQELGSIYKEKLGPEEVVFIADTGLIQKVYQYEGKYPQHMVPDAWTIYNRINGIKRGLFFMDGKEWSDKRKTLNKVFLKSSTINEYTDIFNSVATDFLANWNRRLQHSSSDKAVVTELEKELYNWSIESLGTMIFGRRLGCVAIAQSEQDRHSGHSTDTASATASADGIQSIHEFVNAVQQIFVDSAALSGMNAEKAYRDNHTTWQSFVQAADRALALAKQYVMDNMEQIKRESGAQPGQGIVRDLLADGSIDPDEIVRIIVDLFIAAADTTSHATQWAIYLLARYPECQQKMLDEISRVTGGQDVCEEHLSQLSYVKCVIKEALRLYPVAPFLTRILSEDLELSGYRIPAGKLICVSLYTTGRMENYFTNPNDFCPERWLRDKHQSASNQPINSHACLPFGVGIRSCIGRRVAEVQMQFLLSRIVQAFQLRPTDDQEIGIKLRMITTPERPIHLEISKRNNV